MQPVRYIFFKTARPFFTLPLSSCLVSVRSCVRSPLLLLACMINRYLILVADLAVSKASHVDFSPSIPTPVPSFIFMIFAWFLVIEPSPKVKY